MTYDLTAFCLGCWNGDPWWLMPNMEYCLSTGFAAAIAIAAAAAASPPPLPPTSPWAEWAAGGRGGKCGGINSRFSGRGRHSFTGFRSLTFADS